ncbi:hypothetical protein CNR22_01420 [Sphingobacteriaceae bacterium]|nr:hypothetical protein CNR22_01420 [Sphingobacteriaceae bacterium]
MKTLNETPVPTSSTDLAWKELMEVIRPVKSEISEIAKTNAKNRIKHHPAIITTLEMANWELFG